MRLSKSLALLLSAALLSGTLTACSALRTPYEREKIAENGGVAKKKSDKGGEGSEASEGGGGGGDKKAQTQEAKQKKKDQEPVDPNRAETKGEKKERVKGQGVLYAAPKLADNKLPGAKQPEDGVPQLSYSQKMSSEVSKLEGVEGATVLLDEDHNAYVSIVDETDDRKRYVKAPTQANPSYNVKTEGEITDPLQRRIAEKLRAMDPAISTVHITDDPTHAASFQRYATRATEGKSGDMQTQALAEHIQDIWK